MYSFNFNFAWGKFFFILLSVLFFFSCSSRKNEKKTNIVYIDSGDTMTEIVKKAANVTPSARQYAWQQLEFTAFVHFTINTFTNKEWGDGTEYPALFNPTELDADQWAKVCRDAGMKQIIVTAKHHDGFCLWPSKYTEHSVKNSPWRNGKGDVVREVSDACRKAGLKFGIYLSPWDRHEPSYGDSPGYNEHFKNQLRELLTNYGSISEVWFDGACGEGPNGKRQVYDWQGYYKVIRELQPQAVIAIMGPDVRWVGTESGYGRKTEWSVIPAALRDNERTARESQQDLVYIPPEDRTAEDLGSREKIKQAKKLVWYPSEVDVSIRPGWFYHANQDDRVKTPVKLVDIYYSSVGRNSLLLLNLPPDRRGLIRENDIAGLMEMRRILDATFADNMLNGAVIKASDLRKGHPAVCMVDGKIDTYWTTNKGVESAVIEFILPQVQRFDRLMLQENIRVGQRIERFIVEVETKEGWRKICEGTTVGYKRLLRFPVVKAQKIRLQILQSRASPTLNNLGLYASPAAAAGDVEK